MFSGHFQWDPDFPWHQFDSIRYSLQPLGQADGQHYQTCWQEYLLVTKVSPSLGRKLMRAADREGRKIRNIRDSPLLWLECSSFTASRPCRHP